MMSDICFHCGTEAPKLSWCDDVGNPLCTPCVDAWDEAGRPDWFLEAPLPTSPMVIHWTRRKIDGFWEYPILLGYPGFNGIVEKFGNKTQEAEDLVI